MSARCDCIGARLYECHDAVPYDFHCFRLLATRCSGRDAVDQRAGEKTHITEEFVRCFAEHFRSAIIPR